MLKLGSAVTLSVSSKVALQGVVIELVPARRVPAAPVRGKGHTKAVRLRCVVMTERGALIRFPEQLVVVAP